MVNNFNIIKPLLKWDNADQFYFLQVLQRKKDAAPGMKVNGTNNNSRLIKAYYVKSLDYLEFIEPEIIQLCKIFNARAGINLNKRSFEKTALQNLKLVTDNLINKNFDKVYKTYSSAAGKFSHDKNKKGIIDVDKEEIIWTEQIINAAYECDPIGSKLICKIPSKSGVHLITKPFNRSQFQNKLELQLKEYQMTEVFKLDFQTNNPTNLFCP